MSETSSVVVPQSASGRPAFEFPPLVRAVVSRLPTFPPSLACAVTLSLVAPRVLGADGIAALDGKAFRVVVRDAGLVFAFRVLRGSFEPVSSGKPVDVTFTACAADFALLASRRADPDMLFFDRRLLIEGDTETGLLLRNLLDAIELPRWLAPR